MKILPLPSQQLLHECFIYEEGALFWRRRPIEHFNSERAWNVWNSRFAGSRAGRKMVGCEYRQIGVNGVRYLEHRLIAAMLGLDTSNLIDHKDGTGSNVATNLRPATHSQNLMNSAGWSKKSAGRVGVHRRTNGKWTAYIRVLDGQRHLGTFATEAEATAAREAAEKIHYGEFARHATMADDQRGDSGKPTNRNPSPAT